MSTDDRPSRGFSLKRWSQRKLEATTGAAPPASAVAPVPPPASSRISSPVAPDAAVGAGPHVDKDGALPSIESLTIDSDFTRFLGPKVDETLKRQALKQLFRDPRFNVMDGLDVYVGDYSQPDPISPEIVRGLVQARYIFDPPKTRVNERGEVEDVVDEPSADAVPEAAENASPPQLPLTAAAAPPAPSCWPVVTGTEASIVLPGERDPAQ